MSLSRKWLVCAIAMAMVFVVAGNSVANAISISPPAQQDQKPNNNWVIPVAIVLGGIFILWVGPLF